MGTLYLVATPIGNLKDISLRAIELLQHAEYIACEDTRRAKILLKFLYDSFPQTRSEKPPLLISYFEQNEQFRIPKILNLLQNDKDIVVISDAGTPTISDPGFRLVRECIAQGITISSIPGPSSVITALSVSGLPTDKFTFLGYLPIKPGKRLHFLEELKQQQNDTKNLSATIIFFEAPHRIQKTLHDLQTVFGDIQVVICRELTKVHEEIRREPVSCSLAHFEKNEPRGEFVVLFNLKEA